LYYRTVIETAVEVEVKQSGDREYLAVIVWLPLARVLSVSDADPFVERDAAQQRRAVEEAHRLARGLGRQLT
jgi:hypothetical protein